MAQTALQPTAPDDALARWHAAARPAADLFAGVRTISVIVPHADDETLGCGGLIAQAAARGIAVTVTILTDGAASHPGSRDWPPRRLAQRRRKEARAAVARLTDGRGTVLFGDAPDGALADHGVAPATIAPADLFVTCWQGDPHPDHRAAYGIACAAAARSNATLLAFPLWVLTTDCPVPAHDIVRIDVSAQLARKRAALAEHRSQLGLLVTDVAGFVLDASLTAHFVRADELFVIVPPPAAAD
jgi:LmbE family N-acetylglucosaminyl deacetylase